MNSVPATILLTGATGGIGLEVAKRLAGAATRWFSRLATPTNFKRSPLNWSASFPAPASTPGSAST